MRGLIKRLFFISSRDYHDGSDRRYLVTIYTRIKEELRLQVPFILAIEALMFYIPATVWRLLNQQSGKENVNSL